MAGVSDKDLIHQPGWPAGVNNQAREQALPRDENGTPLAARAIVNMDMVDGKPKTRQGYRRLEEGRWHSPGVLEGVGAAAVRAGDMVRFDRTGELATIRAGVGDRRVSYVEVLSDLWWSNGEEIRRIRRDDFTDRPIGPASPGVPNAAPHPGGGLTAGNYAIAVTWFDAEGAESGAWGSIDVTVAEGEGIRLFDFPAAPESAVLVRIYVSPPNGDELYAAKEIAPGASNVLVTAHDVREAGRALDVLWHDLFPPCSVLRYLNGRLMGVVETNALVWSPALRPQLHHSDAYMRVGADIPMFEVLQDAGAWVADHKATYWMTGTDPKKDWRRVNKSNNSAVRGCSIVVPGSVVGLETSASCAVWIASDGVFCAGLPDGTLIRLKERSLALPLGEEGTILLREQDGLRQLVATYLTRGANGLAIGDRVSATVTRY